MNDATEKSAVAVRLLRSYCPDEAAIFGEDDLILDAPGAESIASKCGGIILADGDEQRATTLLISGAERIFIGEAALRDNQVVTRLCAAHGANRIGVFAPVRRQAVSWGFETTSNADFKTVTPSYCEPTWEILLADGTPTGALALWWLTTMRELGATQFVVRTTISDDADLNLCADLIERLGGSLWLTPAADNSVPLADWIQYGQARQLALPAGMNFT